METPIPRLLAAAIMVLAAGTLPASELVLDVEIPPSRKLKDLSAVLHNHGTTSVFLDPLFPPAMALLQYRDPVEQRWVTVPRPIRCSVVEDRTIEIKPGTAFVPEVFFERHSGEYEGCLEFKEVSQRKREWEVENQAPGTELPEAEATCEPPELAIRGRQLRLRMMYSTSTWSWWSKDVRRQAIYSQVFSLKPGPSN